MSNKPNILLIMCDTVRTDSLSCMGGFEGLTPNLDKLAKEGVLFEQAHSVSPVCCPCRCSLMTGVYPNIHMAVENGIDRLQNLPVVTDYLKKENYHTLMIGKTHFGDIPDSFDVKIISGEKSGNANDAYGVFIKDTGYERASKYPFDKPEEYCIDAFLAKTTIEEIEKVKDSEKPFFAFCSMPSPHGPIDTLKEYVDKFKDVEIPEINISDDDLDNLPVHLRAVLGIGEGVKLPDNSDGSCVLDEVSGIAYEKELHNEIQEFKKAYYALMNYCDVQIGKIVDYINSAGLREDTLIIFTSDHGQQYFDHGFNDKHSFYDESFRVPLIISMPKTLPEGTTEKFATTIDVTTTILSAAGIKIPDHMSGYDLFTPLKENLENPRKFAVGILYRYIALATEKYKFEYYLDEYKGRLFDRINDPNEINDLYDNAEYSKEKLLLIQALLSWHSSLSNVHYYKQNSHGGGPIAKVVGGMIRESNAVSCEDKLAEFISENNLF